MNFNIKNIIVGCQKISTCYTLCIVFLSLLKNLDRNLGRVYFKLRSAYIAAMGAILILVNFLRSARNSQDTSMFYVRRIHVYIYIYIVKKRWIITLHYR